MGEAQRYRVRIHCGNLDGGGRSHLDRCRTRVSPVGRIFPPIEWTEENVHGMDRTVVTRADDVLRQWSTTPLPEWYSPEESYGIEGFAGTA